MKFLAERKHIQILTELDTHRARVQKVDGPRIEQVLENLLSNAVKFSSEGATVSIHSYPEEGFNGFHFVVTDTGPGIPPRRPSTYI